DRLPADLCGVADGSGALEGNAGLRRRNPQAARPHRAAGKGLSLVKKASNEAGPGSHRASLFFETRNTLCTRASPALLPRSPSGAQASRRTKGGAPPSSRAFRIPRDEAVSRFEVEKLR